MVVKANGKIVYDSWKDGSDVYKDKKGYYITQWNPKTDITYKKYLAKSWKPKQVDNKTLKKIKKNQKKSKTKKSLWNIFNV
jgi:hypothetical protein